MTGRERIALGAILLLYLGFGSLYAVLTPAWQNPDEPAHYNYIAHLSEHGRLPVQQPGDYDQQEMEELVRRNFPPDLSVENVRHAGEHPFLYYLLATPVFLLSGGELLPLRLFTLLLGCGVPVLAWRLARRVAPVHVALGAAAFVALLPQHLAMMAAVNNDALAELLIAGILLACVRRLQGAEPRRGETVGAGALIGLALLTKLTAYPVALLGLGTFLLFDAGGRRRSPRAALPDAARLLLPVLVLAAPWWMRNVQVYGWPDLLGLIRHAEVVAGQPRTVDWIATHGIGDWLARGARLTFQSFWGVFGWMGVVVDARYYQAAALLSSVAIVALGMGARGEPAPPARRRVVALLALATAGALAFLVGINLTVVQHQGRYLFPALIPVALALASGWDRAVTPPRSRRLALGLLAVFGGIVVWGLARGDLPGWALSMVGAAAGALWLVQTVPLRLQWAMYAGPFLALALANPILLYRDVLPALQ